MSMWRHEHGRDAQGTHAIHTEGHADQAGHPTCGHFRASACSAYTPAHGKPSCTPAVRHLLPIHAPPLRSQRLVPPPPVRRRHGTLLRTCGRSGAGCGRAASNTNVDATQMGSNKNPCLLQPVLPPLCS